MATYEIRDIETDEIVHTIETDRVGDALTRFESGLERKLDPERSFAKYPAIEYLAKEDACPNCQEPAGTCDCGYGVCDTCGEEWNQLELTDCPNSADALGIDEEDDPEAFEECCEGGWIHWSEA